MSKKIWWSKCLDEEWKILRELCNENNCSKDECFEIIESKFESDMNLASIIHSTTKKKEAMYNMFINMLLNYDVHGQILHLYFMDKELRDFLSSCELMDFEDLKSYIVDNGNFYPVADWNGTNKSQIIDFPFCIHVPYEKHGYTFNCQIIKNQFNLVAKHANGCMLRENEYKALLNIPTEKRSEFQNEKIKLYRLAFNTIAYINCFKDYVKDGVPDVSIDKSERKLKQNGKIIEISKELHEEIEFCRKNPVIPPHIRRGHFMYLKDKRYTNKRGELVWRNPCMVKGKAKTVFTHENIKNCKGLFAESESEE